MPYTFPANTIVLTIADGDWLGNKYGGLIMEDKAAGSFRDRIFLYKAENMGSHKYWVDKLVSTYGLAGVGPEPHVYYYRDKLPLTAYPCQSVQRRIPDQGDIYDNWEVIDAPNPGSGPY